MNRFTLVGILIALLLVGSACYIRHYHTSACVPCFGTGHRLFDDNLTLSDLAARLGTADV